MSSQPTVFIRRGSFEDVLSLSEAIPEFDQPYGLKEYQQRLSGVAHLLLIAECDGDLAGFKIGYAKSQRLFYSWMGGVLPAYRSRGIGSALALAQEEWLRSEGYTTVELKTRNCHRGMLIFALRSGFHITGFSQRENWTEHRIYLRKNLTK